MAWALGCTMRVTRSCCRGSSGRVLARPTKFLSGWLVTGSVVVGWLVMSMWAIRACRRRGSSGGALARPTGFRSGWFPVAVGWLALSLRVLLPASPTSLCLETVHLLASPETLLLPPRVRGRGMRLRSVACSMRGPKLACVHLSKVLVFSFLAACWACACVLATACLVWEESPMLLILLLLLCCVSAFCGCCG